MKNNNKVLACVFSGAVAGIAPLYYAVAYSVDVAKDFAQTGTYQALQEFAIQNNIESQVNAGEVLLGVGLGLLVTKIITEAISVPVARIVACLSNTRFPEQQYSK